jgi:hypothetical protein
VFAPVSPANMPIPEARSQTYLHREAHNFVSSFIVLTPIRSTHFIALVRAAVKADISFSWRVFLDI